MYVEFIQCCKQMFFIQIDIGDDCVYQMLSFFQFVVSVLLYFDIVFEVYILVLEYFVVMQIDSFLQYSLKMQLVCCRVIVKVFLVLVVKGLVFRNCISIVVYQGLIRICFKLVVFLKGFEFEFEDYCVLGEVRIGKWKVFIYKDYVDFFRYFLSFDQMMDFILVDEVFFFVNFFSESLNYLFYDEFVKFVLKIVEKLDFIFEIQIVGE